MSWTDEQLADLRTYAAEHRTVDSACALSLIAEVERLREKHGLAAKLFDVADAEVKRLRALLRDVFSHPESQPSLEAWAKLRREFGKKEGEA